MPQRNKSFSSPSRRNEARRARPTESGEGGYAFLILMMVLTILLISLTVALPDVYTAGQREREEELIFRGNEYARAIMLYHRQFNRFPASVDDLVKKTNGFRFLRHAYRDPMTRSGKWRFIHANANGVVLDSKTLTPKGPKKTEKKEEAAEGPSKEKSQTSTPSQEGMIGAFIVGVASTGAHKSIRVWNNHDRYDEWEFLGVTLVPTGAGGVQPASPSNGAQQGSQTPSMQPRPSGSMTQQ